MLIDVNVSLGQWPFQKLVPETVRDLAAHLALEGIDRALVSPVGAIFHPDPHVYNTPLMVELTSEASLWPAPVINPSLPGWEQRLDEYARAGARAVKVHPNYHLYDLSGECGQALGAALGERGLPLLVQMRVEDERNQYPPLQIAGVPVGQVQGLAAQHPALPIVCLCAYLPEAAELARSEGQVLVDLAFVETLDTVAGFLDRGVPVERVVFGSHTPFLYTRSARMKLDYATVGDEVVAAIGGGTMEGILR